MDASQQHYGELLRLSMTRTIELQKYQQWPLNEVSPLSTPISYIIYYVLCMDLLLIKSVFTPSQQNKHIHLIKESCFYRL